MDFPKKRIDFIHAIQGTKEDIAKKTPKKPKNAKNCRFSPNGQRSAKKLTDS